MQLQHRIHTVHSPCRCSFIDRIQYTPYIYLYIYNMGQNNTHTHTHIHTHAGDLTQPLVLDPSLAPLHADQVWSSEGHTALQPPHIMSSAGFLPAKAMVLAGVGYGPECGWEQRGAVETKSCIGSRKGHKLGYSMGAESSCGLGVRRPAEKVSRFDRRCL